MGGERREKMATIAAFFNSEEEAQHVMQQMALETSIESITYLTGTDRKEQVNGNALAYAETLSGQGFDGDQFNSCLQALASGRTAVIIECSDAADMLVALQAYGVRDYHMV
jgi:hypothetical protein